MSNPTSTTIPTQCGLGLASVILGASCIPLAILVGIASLSVSLPIFGIWFFLPIPFLAIVLGILASRTSNGVAGALLGVVALLICLGFVVADRFDGPAIRAQLSHGSSYNQPAGLTMEQLMQMTRPATSQPANP